LIKPLEEAARAAFGPDISVELGLYEAVAAAPVTSASPSTVANHVPVREVIAPTPLPPVPYDFEAHLVPRYTFDNFVVGQSNRFACAAAIAVGEQVRSQYNPLFIYGPAGLGKTHLLHAVGHQRREIAPTSVIRYVSSEQFLNEFINGIRRKQTAEFQDRYRKVDVLLVDDVQFLEGKEQILQEFFHTFNTLYEAGKQLVISSDRTPKGFSIEDRLRSRFEWGLITDIQPPDVETRLAILRKNAEHASRPVPEDVLLFIAERVLDNVRELEGALTRVTAYASVNNEKITLELAQEVLQYLTDGEGRQITPELVMERVAARYGLSLADLTGPSRKQPLAAKRQIAMYLCRDLTNLSLPKIGTAFGGRDHTTVIHAVDRVKSQMQSDKSVFDEVTSLCKDLRTP
ncbi:MAG: chromosomal replication initiator protein DnaA, partial [Actinomycetota bacterium]|nr:chromosomal replication initiator protein DnaA [Actinomycetota bacterium]